MPYSFARYTGLALLVSLGVVCMNVPASSESSVSIHAVHSKPEMRSEKPLLFVDTGISVRRTESVVDLLFKNIRLANTGSTNDRLCNYCEDYLAGNVTSEQYKTSYTPLSGYGPDGSSTSSRGLPEIAAF